MSHKILSKLWVFWVIKPHYTHYGVPLACLRCSHFQKWVTNCIKFLKWFSGVLSLSAKQVLWFTSWRCGFTRLLTGCLIYCGIINNYPTLSSILLKESGSTNSHLSVSNPLKDILVSVSAILPTAFFSFFLFFHICNYAYI